MKNWKSGWSPYRPAAYRRPIPRPPVLGQTFDEMMGWSPAAGDLVRLGFHGMTSWLGIYVGIHGHGVLSFFGWFLGIGQGLGALLDVVSLLKRATGILPDEPTSTPQQTTAA